MTPRALHTATFNSNTVLEQELLLLTSFDRGGTFQNRPALAIPGRSRYSQASASSLPELQN